MLIWNDVLNYGLHGTGKHDGAQRGNCKIFVAGTDANTCVRSGNQMWHDYQELRADACGRCGSKHWGEKNECRTTVSWVL